MNQVAHAMHVVQSYQALLGQYSGQVHGDALVLVTLDDLKQIDAEDLECHYVVFAVRTLMDEMILKLDRVAVIRLERHPTLVLLDPSLHLRIVSIVVSKTVLPLLLLPEGRHLIQDFNFVKGRFNVVLRRFLNLQRHVRIVLLVLGQPHSREMSPAKLLYDNVPALENLAHMNGMVTTHLVVSKPLVLRAV